MSAPKRKQMKNVTVFSSSLPWSIQTIPTIAGCQTIIKIIYYVPVYVVEKHQYMVAHAYIC
jgi:hypothetical protein